MNPYGRKGKPPELSAVKSDEPAGRAAPPGFDIFQLLNEMMGKPVVLMTDIGARRTGKLTRVRPRVVEVMWSCVSIPVEVVLDSDDADPIAFSSIVSIHLQAE